MTMSRNPVMQHPEEYREDLNPNYEAGENTGPPTYRMRPASEITDLVQRFNDLRVDELKRIPVLEDGAQLRQGAAYFDLKHPERGEFKAMGGMKAGAENWCVPKHDTDYALAK